MWSEMWKSNSTCKHVRFAYPSTNSIRRCKALCVQTPCTLTLLHICRSAFTHPYTKQTLVSQYFVSCRGVPLVLLQLWLLSSSYLGVLFVFSLFPPKTTLYPRMQFLPTYVPSCHATSSTLPPPTTILPTPL